MNRILTCILLGLAVPFSAAAQEPGQTGPVASLGAPTAATAPAPPSGVVAAAATAPSPHDVAPDTSRRPPKVRSSAPPAEITVDSGRNTVFSVALFHANRIITPFRNPEIRTSSTSVLTVENGIIYVTTQAEDPIGLFVFDKADPAQAISLTLMPQSISPVSVKINLAGWTPPPLVVSSQTNPDVARSWETEDPYITTLKSLFKSLASQKVPDGFGLSTVNSRYQYMPRCDIPGAHIVPVQVLEGAEITAIVARVTNTSHVALDVNEGACSSPLMLGAATWPVSSLNPGESTELYVAIETPHGQQDAGADRPSVVRPRIQ